MTIYAQNNILMQPTTGYSLGNPAYTQNPFLEYLAQLCVPPVVIYDIAQGTISDENLATLIDRICVKEMQTRIALDVSDTASPNHLFAGYLSKLNTNAANREQEFKTFVSDQTKNSRASLPKYYAFNVRGDGNCSMNALAAAMIFAIASEELTLEEGKFALLWKEVVKSLNELELRDHTYGLKNFVTFIRSHNDLSFKKFTTKLVKTIKNSNDLNILISGLAPALRNLNTELHDIPARPTAAAQKEHAVNAQNRAWLSETEIDRAATALGFNVISHVRNGIPYANNIGEFTDKQQPTATVHLINTGAHWKTLVSDQQMKNKTIETMLLPPPHTAAAFNTTPASPAARAMPSSRLFAETFTGKKPEILNEIIHLDMSSKAKYDQASSVINRALDAKVTLDDTTLTRLEDNCTKNDLSSNTQFAADIKTIEASIEAVGKKKATEETDDEETQTNSPTPRI